MVGVGLRGRRLAWDYRGKVAVVTGASAGLGRRLALDLASAGAVVVGVARREEQLQALVEEMRRHTPESCYRVCDLSDAASFVGLLEQVEDEHGRIDILANIAGVGGIIRTEPATAASLRSIMEVNFITPVAGMMTVLPGMRERRFGAIANMSSDDGRAPGPGAADYSASKAALSAATESLSYDARPDGMFLHTVYPGWVPTEMGLTAVRDGGLSCRRRGPAHRGAGLVARAAPDVRPTAGDQCGLAAPHCTDPADCGSPHLSADARHPVSNRALWG